MQTLQGRTAVMTGASGHVGAGAVRALTAGGMNVAMITHNLQDARALVEELRGSPGQCVAVSNEKGDAAALDEIYERFGSLDVVIPNQGGPVQPRPLADITEEELLHTLRHQIAISFAMVQKAAPYLEKSRAGRVILIASSGARTGLSAEGLCDCVARGGVISMTYALAGMLAGKGVTVNCIARSGLENDHPPRLPGELDTAGLAGRIPLGRNGTPAEFGASVAYLASEEAGFLTGQIVNLCGGLYMG